MKVGSSGRLHDKTTSVMGLNTAALLRLPSMQMWVPSQSSSSPPNAPSSPCVRSNSPGLAVVTSHSPTTIPTHVSKGISLTAGGLNRSLFSSGTPQNKVSRKEQLIEPIIE